MTLPDKLTFFRILLTPVIFFTWYAGFYLNWIPRAASVSIWLFFIISEITDAMDGHIARKRGLVSDHGKLLDPFSDTFLRLTYFLCFTASGLMPVWAMAIILWRELSIAFMRMILLKEGIVLAANYYGKIKAILYTISGIGGLICLTLQVWQPNSSWLFRAEHLTRWLFIASAVAALLSLCTYLHSFIKAGAQKIFK
ncbi:MAG: CDP-diacylglycerol--glycerol-3-phosphate 3-phosphatidyltransferase [Spirochaeta sp. LUC14_002_19_P3]|nr:MAG: CDP-diacylglycerol--glycerol-3-phosphate 3-phosphatidyltransferase [Spirochaeta sp. LUC14_002_19_P3]